MTGLYPSRRTNRPWKSKLATVEVAVENFLRTSNPTDWRLAAWASGVALAVGCNLVNNLPTGLVAGRIVGLAHAPEHVRAAVLVGVDLGPNLSVTGSLATLLWLSLAKSDMQEAERLERAAGRPREEEPATRRLADRWLSDPALGPGWSGWRA